MIINVTDRVAIVTQRMPAQLFCQISHISDQLFVVSTITNIVDLPIATSA